MQQIHILRSGTFVETIKPDENSTQVKRIMGENQLNLSFQTSYLISFRLGDYATVFGERYYINKMPVVTKVSTYRYNYTLTMEAVYFDLSKVQLMFYGDDNTLKDGDFSLMGHAGTFVDLVIKNMERVYLGIWTKGDVITSDYKNITFSKENCFNALGKIAEAFETEFYIEGTTIHLIQRMNVTNQLFKHGKGKGLQQIERRLLDSSSVITRLYVFGSDKNLPTDYNNYSKRLQMREANITSDLLVSNVTWTGVGDQATTMMTLTFEWEAPTAPGVNAVQIEYRPLGSSLPYTTNTGGTASPRTLTLPIWYWEVRFRSVGLVNYVTPSVTINVLNQPTPQLPPVVTPSTPILYIEKNNTKYGVIEYTEIFEDIYPSRTGIVTAVDATNIYKFKDNTIDFNVNDQLLPGTTAKVTFNTGQLSGYTFDLSRFDNGIKEFTFIKNQNELSIEVPNVNLKPAIGDKYVLTDIRMPLSYINAAELKLKAKAQEFLDKNSEPQYVYTVTLDPIYMRRKGIVPNIGDVIWLEDAELEVKQVIRIVSVTRDLVNEYNFQVELSDTVEKGTIAQINTAISSNSQSINDTVKNLVGIFNNKVTGDFTIEQGTLVAKDMQDMPVGTTFKTLVMDMATGKFYLQ